MSRDERSLMTTLMSVVPIFLAPVQTMSPRAGL
jgi:hypothetical protein